MGSIRPAFAESIKIENFHVRVENQRWGDFQKKQAIFYPYKIYNHFFAVNKGFLHQKAVD